MGKSKLYRISLKVHPLVWRYIDNNYQKVGDTYDITGSMYYPLVMSLLCRSNVKVPSRVSPKYAEYKNVSVFVTEYDFYHYGYEMSPLQQFKFSKTVKNIIIDQMCRRIAITRAVVDVPLTQLIDLVLNENNMGPEELNAESLRKIYQRKYTELERDGEGFFRFVVNEAGGEDDDFEKKSLVILSQPLKTGCNLWKI